MGSKAREGKSRLECRRPRPSSRKVSKVPTLSEEGTAVWPCKALLSSISPRLERIFGRQSALSRVGERDDPWPKKTSRDGHRYRSEISWKKFPLAWESVDGGDQGLATALPFLIETLGFEGADFFPKNMRRKASL